MTTGKQAQSSSGWRAWRRHCRSSCVETCRTLRQFSEDPAGVKALLRVANNFQVPEGIPSSQWDRLLRGESVDLNQILSSMHFIQLDEEKKGHMGSAEVVFAITEAKRQVKTGSEWSTAFRRASKATTFLFPHRREELLEYAEYIEGLFAPKQVGAHSKVILYDQSVRNQVGGGQISYSPTINASTASARQYSMHQENVILLNVA